MKLYLTIITILLFAFSLNTYSQTSNKTVQWNGSNKCCDNWMQNGELVTAYEDEKLTFLMSLTVEKDYYAVWIGFINKSNRRLTVEPSAFTLRLTEPVNQTYNALDAAEIAKKIKSSGKTRAFFARWGAGMAKKQSTATITDDSGNSANVRITEPDTNARNEAEGRIEERQVKNNSRANSVLSGALRSNTLFNDEPYGGYVYFPKKKAADGLIISFTLDSVTYEIPYGSEREKLNKK